MGRSRSHSPTFDDLVGVDADDVPATVAVSCLAEQAPSAEAATRVMPEAHFTREPLAPRCLGLFGVCIRLPDAHVHRQVFETPQAFLGDFRHLTHEHEQVEQHREDGDDEQEKKNHDHGRRALVGASDSRF
jgi:hypothetical protein